MMNVRSRVVLIAVAFELTVSLASIQAQIVVFHQPGFPTVDSDEISQATLASALGGTSSFVDVDRLRSSDSLKNAKLLVLPYGSAFPAEVWPNVMHYLRGGGNLLLLGGQPLRVPVSGNREGAFVTESPQETYSRVVDFRHSYLVPLPSGTTRFHWRSGYNFLPDVEIRVANIFAQEGRLEGLGYLDAEDGTHLAAPVIVVDHSESSSMPGSRIVALPFKPIAGFWSSNDGVRLIHAAAMYAQAGATNLQIEVQYNTLRPGELPELKVHLRRSPRGVTSGKVEVHLLQGEHDLDQVVIPLDAAQNDTAVPFRRPMQAGVYIVRATWAPSGADTPQEFAENGFQVEDISALESGDALGVRGDFLTLGDKPFFPVGTNYFTTEENGWDFSGPRNAAVWEHDFADMQRHGVNFVRTGVWMAAGRFVEPITGGANERFLRNLEAFLAAAHRHRIAINFTFFAFTPRVSEQRQNDTSNAPPLNPYLDPAALEAERGYIASVVQRFGKIPWLSYDLINEPSFSNPRLIFHGNVPNGDSAELAAWHAWLERHYGQLSSLADAWRTSEDQLGGWSSIVLPRQADLSYTRYGNDQQIRAFDYNLFAQDMFSEWVRSMVAVIRTSGSKQLINVGQDEGGVTNRVLNQFYATSGVSFTTNHTYWQDDALLWDSVAAKRPGMPNITGETGYQPAWNPDGTWRYDELTGSAIEERKLALGFAAGSSGALQWDWAREVDFGIERSDGSAKLWESMMRELGTFSTQASPYATGMTLPDIAIVLPQSLQLSVYNSYALQAQQKAVRTLYHYNRVEVYAVGEYQIETLGTPKLILLPSPFGLTDAAWTGIEEKVRNGAVVLVTGPFAADEHLHPNDRAQKLGLKNILAPLAMRNEILHLPTGDVPLEYEGMVTTIFDRVRMSDGTDFVDLPLGKGRVIFSALPLELNNNLASIAAAYEYALKAAGVSRTYTTTLTNPGILICPTRLPQATLYVLTSETEASSVSFTDTRSGRLFSGTLEGGKAALLLIGEHGDLLANYQWHANGPSRK